MKPIDPARIELMDPAVAEMLRDKSPADCIRMVAACNRSARRRMAGHLKTLHPDWNQQQVQEGVARWLLTSSVTSLSSS